MAKIDELSRKQEVDQRAALLGLAAGKSSAKLGRCLTSQEMSQFLEGESSFEQQQSYLAHFSSCDSCYREWLELQLELSHDKPAAQKPLLFRRRILAVAGSLLATAASVIFYLNLEQSPSPFEAPLPSVPQADMMVEKRAGTKKSSPVPRKEVTETAAAPSIQTSNARPVPMVAEDIESMEQRASTRMKQEGRSFAVTSEEAASQAPAEPPAAAQALLEEWLQRVEESCAQQDVGPDDWKILALQGRGLLLETKFPELSALVTHLEGISRGEKQKAVCTEILKLLKENNYD